MHLLDLKQSFNSVNVRARAGRAFSSAAVLPLCGTCCVNLTATVDPILNAIIPCHESNPKFNTINLILSQNFTRILSSLLQTILTFHAIKNVNIIVCKLDD